MRSYPLLGLPVLALCASAAFAQQVPGVEAAASAGADAATRGELATQEGTPAVGAPTVPGPGGSAANAASRHHPGRTPAQVLDDRVRALTHELQLNPKQQVAAREVLIRERVAILGLLRGRNQAGASSQDFVTQSHAIMERARGEIRALLDEDQRKKYIVEVPQDQLGPAQADLKYWLDASRPHATGSGTPAPGTNTP